MVLARSSRDINQKEAIGYYEFTVTPRALFAPDGKATWLQVYIKADTDVISSLQMLSTEEEVTETMLATLASFVCAAYSPKGIYIKTISELGWHLFCKHMAESDKLPPTLGALRQHVLRVHIQARVWGQASFALQDSQMDPLQNGYRMLPRS
ncbi:unnamed protein product [Boreogadus saida]